MAGDRKEINEAEAEFSVTGLETPEGKARVQEAYKKLLSAYQNSHQALIKLADFLDRPPFSEFLKSIADEFIKSADPKRGQALRTVIEQYTQVLGAARRVRERTSDVNEEFKRALANWPPEQPGEPRKLAE